MYSHNQSEEKVDQTKLVQVEQEEESQLPPLKPDIEWAVNSLKEGKTPGCDNI